MGGVRSFTLLGNERFENTDVSSLSITPPTEKQIEFVQKIAAERGLTVPKEVMNSANSLSEFIDETLQLNTYGSTPTTSTNKIKNSDTLAASLNHDENQSYNNFDNNNNNFSNDGNDDYASEPPTEKQMKFAERLAKERGEIIPKEALISKTSMTSYIDELLQTTIAISPTEKQVSFAKRLSLERNVDIPEEAFKSSIIMSKFIEKALNNHKTFSEENSDRRELIGKVFGDIPLGDIGGGVVRNARVRTYAQKVLVDIRDFTKVGSVLSASPKVGISLSLDQYNALKSQLNSIDQAIEAAKANLQVSEKVIDEPEGQWHML